MTCQQDPDPIEHDSPFSFEETVDRLLAAISGAGMTVFARIDHGANARHVGLAMPPTIVLIYGNAKGGTPIMQAAPRSALDLPLRVLVHKVDDGRVIVAFHPVVPMLRRAGVDDSLSIRLEPAQQLLVAAIRS